MDVWHPAYVGVGSNLNEPRSQVLRAMARLADITATRVVSRSSLYTSRPFGPVAQPDFVNAAAGLLTRLDPRRLLEELQAIEREFGRPGRHERWGPRILDLDLLVYGRDRRQEPGLTLPHPGVVDRNFVLYPLAEIAPHLDVPGLGPVCELKTRVGPEGLHALPR